LISADWNAKNIPDLVNFIPENNTTLYMGRNGDVVFTAV
jgi:hypothetical protein